MDKKITIDQERFGQRLIQVLFTDKDVEFSRMTELPLKSTQKDIDSWTEKVIYEYKNPVVVIEPKSEVEVLKERIVTLEAEVTSLKARK